MPKFGLALPASVWWVVFFAVPVVLVVAASFGSKVPNSAGRVSYSSLSFDNYREALVGRVQRHVLQGPHPGHAHHGAGHRHCAC